MQEREGEKKIVQKTINRRIYMAKNFGRRGRRTCRRKKEKKIVQREDTKGWMWPKISETCF